MPPAGRKVITNKVIIFELVNKNVIFTQLCFVLPITNPIIPGSEFLDIYFVVIGVGDYTITLCCTNYMLTTSLIYDPIYY